MDCEMVLCGDLNQEFLDALTEVVLEQDEINSIDC